MVYFQLRSVNGSIGESDMSDVINIFDARRKKEVKERSKDDGAFEPSTFEEIMEMNQNTKDKLAKERNIANKSVLRSYRIKN